jgi:hypothetical protein
MSVIVEVVKCWLLIFIAETEDKTRISSCDIRRGRRGLVVGYLHFALLNTTASLFHAQSARQHIITSSVLNLELHL